MHIDNGAVKSQRLTNLYLGPVDFIPQAVFFDLDGTLVDSLPDIYAATMAATKTLGVAQPSLASVRSWIGNGSSNLADRVLANSIDTPAIPHPLKEALLAEFMRAYGDINHAYSLIYDGVTDTLSSLAAAHIPMAVITNKSSRFTPSLLRHFGIDQYFSAVYGGDAFAEKKPQPLPLLKACEALSVCPSQCLMVGDSRNDVLAARGAGMPSLAIRGGYNHGEDIALSQPTWVVDSFRSLIA